MPCLPHNCKLLFPDFSLWYSLFLWSCPVRLYFCHLIYMKRDTSIFFSFHCPLWPYHTNHIILTLSSYLYQLQLKLIATILRHVIWWYPRCKRINLSLLDHSKAKKKTHHFLGRLLNFIITTHPPKSRPSTLLI
jgi:hypothetical protein